MSLGVRERHLMGDCQPAESRPLKPLTGNKMVLVEDHANDRHAPGVSRPPIVRDSVFLLWLSRDSSGARPDYALHAQDPFRTIVVLLVAALGFSLSLPDSIGQPLLLFL